MDPRPSQDVRESLRLDRSVEAPRQARMGLEGLRERVPADLFEDVRLLVSELVTNSVLHGGADQRSWVEVNYELIGGALRVEVADPGPGFSATASHVPGSDDVSGRGLYIVRTIADRWGVDGLGVTRVWFEFDVPELFVRSASRV